MTLQEACEVLDKIEGLDGEEQEALECLLAAAVPLSALVESVR